MGGVGKMLKQMKCYMTMVLIFVVFIEIYVTFSRHDANYRNTSYNLFESSRHENRDAENIIFLSFNIRHGKDDRGKVNLNKLIYEIKETHAQIIALQEVDRYMPRSSFKDEVKEIANKLGYEYVYGETINVMGIRYGNATLSAYPILKHENIIMPSNSIEPRGILASCIDVNGMIYNVFNTHLGLNAQERMEQIKKIKEVVSIPKENIILMGDFNIQLEGELFLDFGIDLIDAAIQTGNDDIYTYSFYSTKPDTRIDAIYTSRDIDIKEYFVFPSEVSDHYMVGIKTRRD
jgi:endonuclease/exonuclease/phosphatase family metal-dependent hydrolase